MAVEKDWTNELTEVVFEPGDFLFHESERSYHFFVIVEGEVEIFKTGDEGTAYPLARVSPPTSIGEFAMIDRQARSASARAITQVRATKISEEAYEHLLEELPEWAISVMKALVQRLRQTNEIIRKHKAVTGTKILEEVSSLEFDSDSSLIGENPFLKAPDEN
jgi:CRP-like cAMP-binding protein